MKSLHIPLKAWLWTGVMLFSAVLLFRFLAGNPSVYYCPCADCKRSRPPRTASGDSLLNRRSYQRGGLFFYTLGRTLHGSTRLERYAAVRKIKAKFDLIQTYGIWAVMFTRMIPSGPFSLVNLVTGMLGFSPSQFAAGTLIGLAPAILAFSSFGNVLVTALSDPHGENMRILIILGCLYAVFMGGLIFAARRFFAHRR